MDEKLAGTGNNLQVQVCSDISKYFISAVKRQNRSVLKRICKNGSIEQRQPDMKAQGRGRIMDSVFGVLEDVAAVTPRQN